MVPFSDPYKKSESHSSQTNGDKMVEVHKVHEIVFATNLSVKEKIKRLTAIGETPTEHQVTVLNKLASS
jgi:hypothetical protein